jgi:octaprenyl-diphosphate synthase
LKGRGKRLRPIVFFLVQGLFSKPDERSLEIAVLIELLHTATLIHDDVIDGSMERRGSDTLNAVWGDRISVLMGDLLLAKVLQLGVRSPWPGVLETIAPVVHSMVTAELRHEMEPPDGHQSEAFYFRIISDKTAGLFSAAAILGGIVKEASEDRIERLRLLGSLYGTAFQIRDDILDVTGSPDIMGKPRGQDALNGRWTLPLLMARKQAGVRERKALSERMGTKKPQDSAWIHDFIIRHQGVPEALRKCDHIVKDAVEILRGFDDSIYRKSLMALLNDVTEREE